MKISEVKSILDRNFPDRTNWPGREAEIRILARTCSNEGDVIERLVNPTSEHINQLWTEQREIERDDPHARVEFEDEVHKLSLQARSEVLSAEDLIEQKNSVTDFLEKNDLHLSRAQIRVLFLNCKNITEITDMLGSINFADLVREMELEIEEQDKDRLVENKIESRNFTVLENQEMIEEEALINKFLEMNKVPMEQLKIVLSAYPEAFQNKVIERQLAIEAGTARENKGEDIRF